MPGRSWRASPSVRFTSATSQATRQARTASGSRRASSNTRGRALPRSRRSCAARSRRSQDERNVDRRSPQPRRPGTLRRLDGHPVSRSHARAGRPARRRSIWTSRRAAISTSISITRSRTSASRSARRSPRRLASQRGINRAGYFVMPMDETLGVAAIDLGGRAHAVVDLRLKVTARRRPAGGTGDRLLRGFRAGRARQRAPEGALRPLEPPPGRGAVQGVRPRAARSPARATGGSLAMLPSTKGLFRREEHRPHRLRRRQSDVGAERLRGSRRGSLFTPSRPAELARRHGDRRPWRRSFRRDRGVRTDAWRQRFVRRVADGTPLLGICLGLQWLFEGSDEAPDVPGLGAAAGTLHAAAATRSKVPHVGWNALTITRPSRLLDGSRRRHAGVLHALVRRAGHRRLRRVDDARRALRGGRRARQRLRRAVSSREVGRGRAAASSRTSSRSSDRLQSSS